MHLIRASVAAALACALVACGGDDQPQAPPETIPSSSSPSSSSTTSTSEPPSETAEPTPTPPPLPPEAQNPDAAGAGAFVRHWFDLANYAYATGDTAPMVEKSEPDCATCSNVVETIESQYETGGSFAGGEIVVLGAEAAPPDDTGVTLVSTRYEQAELREVDANGDVGDVTPPAPATTVGFVVAYVDGSWFAAGVGT